MTNIFFVMLSQSSSNNLILIKTFFLFIYEKFDFKNHDVIYDTIDNLLYIIVEFECIINYENESFFFHKLS